MANPHRGEVDLPTDEGDLVLRFTMNSLCALEEKMGMPIASLGEIIQDPQNFKMSTARIFLWAGLIHARPEITVEEAGNLSVEGGFPVIMKKAFEAFTLAFPNQEARPSGSRPPKAVKG